LLITDYWSEAEIPTTAGQIADDSLNVVSLGVLQITNLKSTIPACQSVAAGR